MPLQLHDLLSKGYFPIELPPPFNTASYADAIVNNYSTSLIRRFQTTPRFSMMCVHNLVRSGGLRRNLSIPNPKHFFLLADHIVNNWTNHLSAAQFSPFSLTKPVTGNPIRAISPEFDLSERTLKIAELRTNGKFILKADITRFFPSIYTHSIPWAIMGKPQAKAAHLNGTLRNTWQDQTDTFARSINNNQTIGIPIGPDTSRLIAEIILSRIDLELANKFKKLKGMRFIDDYEFSFINRSDAENVLSFLQHLLNEFELALNSSKTSIIELPYTFEPLWTSKIRTYRFRAAGITGQKNDLSAYFDMVYDFMRKLPDEGILKYAIGRLKSESIRKDNWKFFQNILCQCIVVEPACLPQVCEQIIKYKNRNFPITKKLWSTALNQVIFERVPLGHSSEAVWAMWLLNIINIKLSVRCTKVIAQNEDSIVSLMALGLADKGLANMTHLSLLNRYTPNAELYEKQWLLCYQMNLNNWLRGNRNNLNNDQAFSFLESNNVSFFDINTPFQPITAQSGSTSIFGGGGGY